MQLTAEQVCVVRSRARRLTVQAGAGAAKTTTLGAYADARRGSRVLYLALYVRGIIKRLSQFW